MRSAANHSLVALILGLASSTACAANVPDETPAQRGYRLMRTTPYSPAELTSELFDGLWKVWPADLRDKAQAASPEDRRQMALERYGLVADPERPDGPPMGVVDDGKGGWVMSCLACHQGKVAGRVILGLGNSHYAFETLQQDAALALAASGKKTSAGASVGLIPLGKSNGTTNAQIFSVLLTAMRDKDLNPLPFPKIPKFKNHDLDAPPYWNVKHKKNLYIDGFVPKTHRVIMQFALVPSNKAEQFKTWENDFQDILAWIDSLEAPKYPYPIDDKLAASGQAVFNRACADCHGTYGPHGKYPEKMVPIDVVGTDSLRLTGMPAEHRRFYRDSWFGEYGKLTVTEEPEGYVAPPLHGIWASGPYFHNGSIPTLWHVMHSDQRPKVWLRTADGYDQQRVGLEVSTFDALPSNIKRADEKRRFFETRMPGKSAVGHLFPDELSEDEKQSVLEYLKTL